MRDGNVMIGVEDRERERERGRKGEREREFEALMLLALKMEEGAMSREAKEFRWYLEAGKDGKWILP